MEIRAHRKKFPGGAFYLLAVFLLLLVFKPGHCQDHKISLHYKQASIREVMNDLEKQTGLVFSYSSKLLKDQEKLSIELEQVELDSALRTLFEPLQIRYVRIEKQLVLKKERRQVLKLEEELEEEIPPVFYTVSGYVRDVASGEILIGATISTMDYSIGTITNNYGFFSLTLREKVDSLRCSYMGYSSIVQKVNGLSEVIHFLLKEKRQSIQEVVVYSEEEIDEIRSTRSSQMKVKTESVRKMPALLGEKDVIKALASVPGIKFFGDGSTIFYVRGGSRDQNLVTIDEAPVYNPTHLMGFFSTIVPDAVKEVKVYKGDFPANYGGRLSSLVDIRTKDGNMQHFAMDASVGLLSSRLTLEGPIWKDRISYFISGRKSHVIRSLQRMNPNIGDLSFGDLHMKLNYRMNDRNRFYFSLYRSQDNFEVNNNINVISGINWQNSTLTLRWNHLFSERLFSNITLLGSRYDYYMYTDKRQGNYWNSHIDNVSLKADFTYYISQENTLKFGAKIAQHFMNPGNFYINNSLFSLPYEISTKSANENSLYISDQMYLSDRLTLRAGLRLTAWNNIGPGVEYSYVDGSLEVSNYAAGQLYYSIPRADPRLGLVYQNESGDLLKASYTRTSQFEHLITNSISPFSTLEVWLPSGPNIKPQQADQLTFAYQKKLAASGLRFEAEVYYKKMSNQIDYRDHAKLLMNPFLEANLLFGTGEAYGLETMLTKTEGRFNGWISYTLSRSYLQVQGINNNDPYPSYGDRPHDLSLFASWKINPRLELSGNFIYMTGAPFTAPMAFYYRDNIQVPIYFKRNNDRLPDYHRMDVALNWNLRKKEGRFQHELIFSIYNLYGRKNPVAIHFNKIEGETGQLITPYNFYGKPELVATQFYIYGTIPSVSYHFSF